MRARRRNFLEDKGEKNSCLTVHHTTEIPAKTGDG
jgi:hypothetical protein